MNLAYRGGGAVEGWSTEAAYVTGGRTSPGLLTGEMAEHPAASLLISREGAALVASVWLDRVGKNVWHLGSLAIDPALQNQGAGRRLLATAEAWVEARGGRTLRMSVVNVRDALIAW